VSRTFLGELYIVSDFKTLQVWQKAHALSLHVDRACKGIRLPMYASLRNQLFRAAMSISANIAEGSSQRSKKEFAESVAPVGLAPTARLPKNPSPRWLRADSQR
jgi:hypothetical protein